jgi:peptidoglycan/xylan/chitin deacetylase (PgdA/CDA1 family)
MMLRAWNALGWLDYQLSDGTVPSAGSDAVLMFHSVGDRAFDDLSPASFRRRLQRLDETVEFVDLPTIYEEPSDRKRVALTFDDGYRGFYEHVVPALDDLDIPATVFVVAGTLTDGQLRVDEAVDGRYMSPTQLRDVASADPVTIGNHTMTHPNLGDITAPKQLEREIADAKHLLEDYLDVTVDRFCYPYNDYTPAAVRVARRTHEYAVRGGGWEQTVSIHTNPYLIPRVNGSREWWRLRWHLLDRSAHLATAVKEFRAAVRSW